MTQACPIVIVSGFLGAGKSRLVETLTKTTGAARFVQDWVPDSAMARELAGPDAVALSSGIEALAAAETLRREIDKRSHASTAVVIETDGLRDPRAIAALLPPGGDVRIVTVVDAVNLVACLDDPDCAALVTAQIRAADGLVLARSDVVDPAPARSALSEIASVPVLDPQQTRMCLAGLLEVARTASAESASPWPDLSEQYATWTYRGPAVLETEPAEALLRDRPKGVYRLKGQVITGAAGLELQVFGHARQTRPVPAPEQTLIVAIGLKTSFRPHEMDWCFTQAVAASAYLTGMISCR